MGQMKGLLIVGTGGKLEIFRKLEAGKIVLGYDSAIVKADSNSEYAKEYKKWTGKEVSFF